MNIKERVLSILCESRTKDALNSLVKRHTKVLITSVPKLAYLDKYNNGRLEKLLKELLYEAYASFIFNHVKGELTAHTSPTQASFGVFIFLNMLKSSVGINFKGSSIADLMSRQEWEVFLKAPKDHVDVLNDIKSYLSDFIAEEWHDYSAPLIAYLESRERFKDSANRLLRDFANLDPMKLTFHRLMSTFTKASRFFNDQGHYIEGSQMPIEPQDNQELVARKGKFTLWKLTRKEQCNDPYFAQGATYCVTTKNYFGAYGGPPYYVIMEKHPDGFSSTYAALVPNILKEDSGDVENLFRDATNTRMLSAQEARPVAELIRKAIPASIILKYFGPRSLTFFTQSDAFTKLLAAVYGKELMKKLRYKAYGDYIPVYYKILKALLRKLHLRFSEGDDNKFKAPDRPNYGIDGRDISLNIASIRNDRDYKKLLKLVPYLKKLARRYRLDILNMDEIRRLPKTLAEYKEKGPSNTITFELSDGLNFVRIMAYVPNHY